MCSLAMRAGVLTTLSWKTLSMASGVGGVPGAAVHGPVVAVCGPAHDSATLLCESWVKAG